MKLRTRYLLAFSSNTLITLIVVGLAIFGFYRLNGTTNYLVTINSEVLQYASLYEKNLAQSRRAEKEFFIFPDKPAKQDHYVKEWNDSIDRSVSNLKKLEDLFIQIQNEDLLQRVLEAQKIITKNRHDWATVVRKFKAGQDYDSVNNAEYGVFKKRTHILEDTGRKISNYGLVEVKEGRGEIARTQKQTMQLMYLVAGFAALWGILVPIILARQLTNAILYLSRVAGDISKGKIGQKIELNRKDELGDLAHAIGLIQISLRILIKRMQKEKKA